MANLDMLVLATGLDLVVFDGPGMMGGGLVSHGFGTLAPNSAILSSMLIRGVEICWDFAYSCLRKCGADLKRLEKLN